MLAVQLTQLTAFAAHRAARFKGGHIALPRRKHACLPGCLQVLREGQRQTIPAEELVPGDIVLIKSGDKVPADLRLITSNNLQVSSGVGGQPHGCVRLTVAGWWQHGECARS
jgi:high-affinity K+ transport system ATPase subunit B